MARGYRRTGGRAHPGGPGNKAAGFTLLELMIVVAVIAILATLAYASYQDQVVRSRRAAAAGCIQERAQMMERYYSSSATLSYLNAPNPAACDPNIDPRHYRVSFSQPPTAAAPRAYTLQVVPQGAQATADAECGTLRINQLGQRTQTGSGTAEECW